MVVMQVDEVTSVMIKDEAARFAQQFGWLVEPGDCSIQSLGAGWERTPGARPRWVVMMAAQPGRNARLRASMPLVCHIELLNGWLYPTQFSEPSDRAQYLRA